MRKIYPYIYILGIFIILLVFLQMFNISEGFNTMPKKNENSTPDTPTRFWDITRNKNTPTTSAEIRRVSDPDPKDSNDTMPLRFSPYISIYALAKYNYDISGARNALLRDYDTIQNEMTTNLYDQNEVNKWNDNPHAVSCDSLKNLRNMYISKLSSLKYVSANASENVNSATAMQDENMNYQVTLKKQCNPKSLSTACINLATQSKKMFPLPGQYDSINMDLFTKEVDISSNLYTINTVYSLLRCDPVNNLKFDATTMGIDTSNLLSKLRGLSPYYISPDVINFITKSIISGNNVNTTLSTTSDRLINITKLLQNMKTNLLT